MSEAEEILKELQKVDSDIEEVDKERVRIIQKLQLLKAKSEELKTRYNNLKSKEASNINWAGNTYGWIKEIYRILTDTFKLREFRYQQLAAINALLSKKDVILLMPTGGGKSLCYQLPALVTKGITVVVSPLLSLIDDQLITLQKLGICALALNSHNSKSADGKTIFEALAKGGNKTLKIIFVTPEYMAKSKKFMSGLQKCHARGSLDRFAIDEVHCCSQWGHDFRPDFKYLHMLKNLFPDVPLIGLTATATDSVIADCQKMLGIEGCVILKASYNRPNLYYEVKTKPANQKACVELLRDMIQNKYKEQSGIIYTTTVNESVSLAKALRQEGISAANYHAHMEVDLRHRIHIKWLDNQYKVIVATVAFGMGIDKPDVRFVIHHTLPKSMASFYQESGRAGRDGKRADCILLYNFRDIFKNSSMVASSPTGSENLYDFVRYCLDVKTCRRSIIATHFDDVWNAQDCKQMCDHCLRPGLYEKIDITEFCLDIHKVIDNSAAKDIRLTPKKLLDAWFKDSAFKKPRNGDIAENIVVFLMVNHYLKEDLHFTPYNTISYLSKGITCGDRKVSMYIKTSHQRINNDNSSKLSSTNRKRKELEKAEKSSKEIKKPKMDNSDVSSCSASKSKRTEPKKCEEVIEIE